MSTVACAGSDPFRAPGEAGPCHPSSSGETPSVRWWTTELPARAASFAGRKVAAPPPI